jgi:hypothetical protein
VVKVDSIEQYINGPEWQSYVAEREAEFPGGDLRVIATLYPVANGTKVNPSFFIAAKSTWVAPCVIVRQITREEWFMRGGMETELTNFYLCRVVKA